VTKPETLASYVRGRMDEVGIDSIRGLATRTGIAPETARRILVRDEATPDERTLQKIAENLPASIQKLRRLAGRPAGEREPFLLPPEADQLDERQRSVVLAVVHALLDAATAGVQQPGGSDVTHASSHRPRLVGRARDTNGLNN
jgi:hypothetical protein